MKLLLPALIPSWRFFDTIAASPRIEFTLLASAEAASNHWQEFRPRPARLSFVQMLKRLIWNREWNESLFLVSCAERLMTNPTDHSEREIVTRIQTGLSHTADTTQAPYMQFRLAFLSRNASQIEKEITFISRIYPSSKSAVA